ncbi:hypothetical protein AK812_SmicGene42239 [Symbiodinium microadriaticum]|uniref:Uncharacterized protein n=1 Tax=Symbiodinium microadriaticum TaxID=2951 RepID=A0A1Q9C422_SYMMI|nr:hypothetical protein AK812_SmicGene42239 [Symbiodinium microadriaticum]
MKSWLWPLALCWNVRGTEIPPAKMLQMGRIMQCVFCQILASEIDVGYRDVAESEARRKLKQHCSAIAPRIAALSGATSPKESEAFCARMVREHGGDMLDAKSMGEDLKSFCEQDDFCRPGRDAQADDLVEGILTNFQREEDAPGERAAPSLESLEKQELPTAGSTGSLLVFAEASSPAASVAQAASKAAGVYQLEALLSAACTQDLRLQAFQMPVRRPSRAAEKVYVVGWETYLRGASCTVIMASPGGRTRSRSWLLACGLGGSLAFLRGPRGVALRARARQDEAPVLQHFIADSPLLRGTKVGGDDAPTVFLVAPPSEQLTKYVLEDPAGPFKGTLEWPERLFDDVDGKNEPDVADHAPGSWKKWSFQFSKREPFMLKADWHSVHDWGQEFDIFVPRKNAVVPVPQAPPRVLALIEAFRKVNSVCWQQITSGLQELQEQKPDDILRCRLLKMLIEEFQERGFFGAIEAQAGPARRKEMHWHRDGATGLLHLGITLSGRRRLQLRARSEDDSWTQELWMDAGHVYLSSPFLFDHSITYAAESSDSGPTLALMCRFGFLDEEDALWVNHFRGRDMLEVVELISGCLRNATDAGELRMPTLSEVSAMEKQLAT